MVKLYCLIIHNFLACELWMAQMTHSHRTNMLPADLQLLQFPEFSSWPQCPSPQHPTPRRPQLIFLCCQVTKPVSCPSTPSYHQSPHPTPATAVLSSCKTSFLPMHSYQSLLDANYQIQSPFISKPPFSYFILLKLIRYDLGYRHWAKCWLAYGDWLRWAWISNQGQLNFYWVCQFIVCLIALQGEPKKKQICKYHIYSQQTLALSTANIGGSGNAKITLSNFLICFKWSINIFFCLLKTFYCNWNITFAYDKCYLSISIANSSIYMSL